MCVTCDVCHQGGDWLVTMCVTCDVCHQGGDWLVTMCVTCDVCHQGGDWLLLQLLLFISYFDVSIWCGCSISPRRHVAVLRQCCL
jgi:hypothetical protein